MKEANILINEETLKKRVKEVAEEIMSDYKGKKLTLICILKGSIFFTVDLAKEIKNDLKIEFIRVSSYNGGTESSGKINLKIDLDRDITGEDVIIIEDIIDTGRTIKFLKEHLANKNANSVKICTLLDKKERREFDVTADYVAFDIPDKFVIGYGLDYDELYRDLPYVGYFDV